MTETTADTLTSAFLDVITARHCKRAFLSEPVPRETLERVLRAAGHAPSPRNTQFWGVEILTGDALAELSREMCAELDAGAPGRHDYVHRPETMGERHEERAFEWGAAFYGTLGIDRDDAVARREFIRRNLHFYGAPVGMVFHLPRNAVPGTFLEMGFFVQNVMLGLVASGLGSCPQNSVAAYADVIREHLGLGPDRLVVCGMSVGHPDEDDPVNAFFPERAPLDEYARWHGWGPGQDSA